MTHRPNDDPNDDLDVAGIAALMRLPPDPARDRIVAEWVRADSATEGRRTVAAGAMVGDIAPAARPLPACRPSEGPAGDGARTLGRDRCTGRDGEKR